MEFHPLPISIGIAIETQPLMGSIPFDFRIILTWVGRYIGESHPFGNSW